MRIVISKPSRGKTNIVVEHKGSVLRFRRTLENVDTKDVRGALLPVLEEWERQRDAVKASLS